MIKNLVFDFGGVLLESDFTGYLDRIISDQRQREQLKALLFTREFTDRLDLGCQSSAELFGSLQSQYPHLALSIDLFQARWMEHLIGEMPGMYSLLERYRQQGYRLFGLSNWSDQIYPVIERYPIFRLLEGRVVSCEEHLIKPDPAIYHCLLRRFGLMAEECVFVDDKVENIKAARALGMHGIVFSDASQLESECAKIFVH